MFYNKDLMLGEKWIGNMINVENRLCDPSWVGGGGDYCRVGWYHQLDKSHCALVRQYKTLTIIGRKYLTPCYISHHSFSTKQPPTNSIKNIEKQTEAHICPNSNHLSHYCLGRIFSKIDDEAL